MLPNRNPACTPWHFAFLVVAALVIFITAPALALDLSMNAPPAVTPAISKGDSVVIHGIATGHPANGLQIWLIGNNYATVSPVNVNEDNTFSFELKPSETQDLQQGQYFVLVQHPMMNGEFDVAYDPGTGRVTRLPDGKVLFILTGAGRIQASDAAAALVNDIGSQNIDDMFSAVSFFVSPPATSIDPVGDHTVGDRFVITGPTNLAAGDMLTVEVLSSSFHPTTKMQSGEFTGSSGTVAVQAGSAGFNRWSFAVDTAGWKPDEYSVTVSAILQDVTASTTFRLDDVTVATPATPAPTTVLTSASPAPSGSTSTAMGRATTTPSAPAGIFPVFIGALVALLIAGSRQGKV